MATLLLVVLARESVYTMRDLVTPIGTFFIDDVVESDTRVGVRDVEIVENRGPDSTYAWSLDQEEAIQAAARDVGAEASLLVPGGWRIVPGSAIRALAGALEARAREMRPTGRRIVR